MLFLNMAIFENIFALKCRVNETAFSNNLYSKVNKYYKSLKNVGECYGRNWF